MNTICISLKRALYIYIEGKATSTEPPCCAAAEAQKGQTSSDCGSDFQSSHHCYESRRKQWKNDEEGERMVLVGSG